MILAHHKLNLIPSLNRWVDVSGFGEIGVFLYALCSEVFGECRWVVYGTFMEKVGQANKRLNPTSTALLVLCFFATHAQNNQLRSSGLAGR